MILTLVIITSTKGYKMDINSDLCQACSEATTCSKDIVGYKKCTFEGRSYGKLFDNEADAWESNGTYNGSFEVYPVCA